jgi:carnitine O-acetyltransferase
VRSATQEVLEFCEATLRPLFPATAAAAAASADGESPTGAAYQLNKMKKAIEAHVENMKCAKQGQGVDRYQKANQVKLFLHLFVLNVLIFRNLIRHLFGLRRMLDEGEAVPALFTDAAFTKSSHWRLSTSHCGSKALKLFGFGPVVPDGFGVGYAVKNDNISFTITGKVKRQLLLKDFFFKKIFFLS